MIEKQIAEYLASELDSVPVYVGEKPHNATSKYVLIQVMDGGRINYIDAVTFSLYSYDTSLQKAAELNALVKEAMFNAVSLPNVSSSKCGGGGQSIDTQTKRYAYECIFNLFYTEE